MEPGATSLSQPALDAATVAALAPARLYSLSNRVAIVTGAAGGVGRWLAAGLGAAGAQIVLTDLSETGLRDVAATLEEGGITAHALPADLRDDAAPARIVDGALDRFGRIDVLVNCAAVQRRQPIADVDRETFDAILGLDLRAPYFLSQAVAPVMAESGGGSIISIGSINCAVGLESVSVYGIAKIGLSQLTKVMAIEWSHLGIRANCLAPGFLLTPLSRPVWENRRRASWMMERIPMRRPGLPAELVGLCVLLASDAGSYITGQTLYADGGFLVGSRWDSDLHPPAPRPQKGEGLGVRVVEDDDDE